MNGRKFSIILSSASPAGTLGGGGLATAGPAGFHWFVFCQQIASWLLFITHEITQTDLWGIAFFTIRNATTAVRNPV
ncbi:MAG TPA: hypothetical protein VL728_08800 [Cyclobacteriaceae bacterium]|nr:hypothetical protein [Cyclobacteriaceae bacterium]